MVSKKWRNNLMLLLVSIHLRHSTRVQGHSQMKGQWLQIFNWTLSDKCLEDAMTALAQSKGILWDTWTLLNFINGLANRNYQTWTKYPLLHECKQGHWFTAVEHIWISKKIFWKSMPHSRFHRSPAGPILLEYAQFHWRSSQQDLLPIQHLGALHSLMHGFHVDEVPCEKMLPG